MTFGVCPWEKVRFPQKKIFMVAYLCNLRCIGLLLFDKKVEGNEVAVAHEYKGNGACLLMDIRWSGVLFVVLGFSTRGSRLTNVQRTAILLFTFWDARDVLGSIFMVANTSDGCR
jgi:hypothetical protein